MKLNLQEFWVLLYRPRTLPPCDYEPVAAYMSRHYLLRAKDEIDARFLNRFESNEQRVVAPNHEAALKIAASMARREMEDSVE